MSFSAVQISSRENAKLKEVRKIRDGKNNRFIFIEGARVCEETLRAKLNLSECFFETAFADSERGKLLIEKISSAGAKLFEVNSQIFSSISETKTSQGIALITEKPATGKIEVESALNLNGTKLVVFLSEINNPANLGAILRTAEAAAVTGIIVSKNSADVFSPKSIRAALGANLRLPIWTNADFYEVIEWAETNNLTTTAADINCADKYTEIDWKIPRLLIFGSEAHGLPNDKSELIQDKIYIPMENEVESLNLAVSCGIILFEAKRNM